MSDQPMPERFQRLSNPDVDRALAASYAIVATADGDVSESEQQKLRTLLGVEPEDNPDVAALLGDANALAHRMMDDFEPAYRIASARLKKLQEREFDDASRELVIDVARALIVADGVIAGREETALMLIARDLGLPAVQY